MFLLGEIDCREGVLTTVQKALDRSKAKTEKPVLADGKKWKSLTP